MRPTNLRTRSASGFTLVELLVVISIIALLLGILLPALASVREAGRAVVCKANLSQIGKAAMSYQNEHDDWLPGSPGATGRKLLNDPNAGSDNMAEMVQGLATQPFDWAGPLGFDYLAPELDLPETRSGRFALLNGTSGDEHNPLEPGPLETLLCPSNRTISIPFNGSPQPQGVGPFHPQLAMSYTAAREFLWWASQPSGGSLPSWAGEHFWGTQSGTTFYPGWETLTLPGGNTSYKPNMDSVGRPSQKIFLADGHRFQQQSLTAIDHDVRVTGSFGGAFADPGAWDAAQDDGGFSRAWPVGQNTLGVDMSGLSFRHGGDGPDAQSGDSGDRGNVLFWDGHVEQLSITEARRPELWLPSRSKVSLQAIWEGVRGDYEDQASGGAYGQFGGAGMVTIW